MKRKYNNTKVNGYDSKRESKRANDLKLLQITGFVSELKEQVKYLLIPAHYEYVNGKNKCIERECSYKADFTYWRHFPDGSVDFIVEDVKGVKTEVYRIKKKLMLHVHGIKIKET